MLKLVKSVCRIYNSVGFYLPIKTYCVIACSVDLMMEMMLVIWAQNLFSHSAASATVEKAFLGQAEQSQFYRIPPLLQKSGFQYIFDVNIRYFWADSF